MFLVVVSSLPWVLYAAETFTGLRLYINLTLKALSHVHSFAVYRTVFFEQSLC